MRQNAKLEPAYGTDLLRIWVASVDSTRDVLIGPGILAQTFEGFRKIRNTARFLLGNIARDRVVNFDVKDLGLVSLIPLFLGPHSGHSRMVRELDNRSSDTSCTSCTPSIRLLERLSRPTNSTEVRRLITRGSIKFLTLCAKIPQPIKRCPTSQTRRCLRSTLTRRKTPSTPILELRPVVVKSSSPSRR